MQIWIILETVLLYRAAESADLIVVRLRKTLPSFAWKQDQRCKMQVCGGWTAQAAHVAIPTVAHVWLRCVILCWRWEKMNSHSLSSIMINKMCPDPGIGSPLAVCAGGMWCVTGTVRLTSFMSPLWLSCLQLDLAYFTPWNQWAKKCTHTLACAHSCTHSCTHPSLQSVLVPGLHACRHTHMSPAWWQ